ncbi:MAG: CHRD domain-containing protein [Bryobacteraceae bacterium]
MCLLAALAALATGAFAARVETIPYRAILSSANENPPVTPAATGAANIFLHIVRDDAGNIVSGSVDFNVSYKFAAAPVFTAMHIHRGTASTNGPVVIDTALPRQDSLPATGNLPARQAQFTNSGTALDAVAGILTNPDQFYFNVHTVDNPGGAMRGQLQKAQMGVFMGLMSPANEVPAIAAPSANTGGTGMVTILRTYDSIGNLTSGWIAFDVNYRELPAGSITAMHIHTGPAGVAGPVTLDSAMTRTDIPDGGNGTLHFENELNVGAFATAAALDGVFNNPAGYYINSHTTYAGGGYIRAQLRATDTMEFQVNLSPSNEVPAIASTASAPSRLDVRTIRNADGTVAAASVIFDTNPRFPDGSVLTAMHIHDQSAGVNGPVTIDSTFARDAVAFGTTGTGNFYKQVMVSGGQALISLNDVILNPEKHYWNIHTATNGGGLVRSQLAAPPTAPSIGLMISAVTDITRTTAAPGSLMRLFGNNLMRVSTNLAGFAPSDKLPTTLNGTSIMIGGTAAPILASSDTEMVVQVPAEVTGTSVPVVVMTPGGSSAAFPMPLAPSAPDLFFDSVGGLILKNADFALVRPENPAKAGEFVLIYASGLGQTTPPLATGRVAPDASYQTPAAKVTIGGVNADVIYSIASPGFVGLSQTAVRVPAGLKAGNQPVVLTVGTATSNTVQIAVQ